MKVRGGGYNLIDPTPNYVTELLKCQRYQYVIPSKTQSPTYPGFLSLSATVMFASVVLPTPLYKKPTVVIDNLKVTIRTISGYSPNADYTNPGAPNSVTADYPLGLDSVTLYFRFSVELGPNNTPAVVSLRSGYILLDANL